MGKCGPGPAVRHFGAPWFNSFPWQFPHVGMENDDCHVLGTQHPAVNKKHAGFSCTRNFIPTAAGAFLTVWSPSKMKHPPRTHGLVVISGGFTTHLRPFRRWWILGGWDFQCCTPQPHPPVLHWWTCHRDIHWDPLWFQWEDIST